MLTSSAQVCCAVPDSGDWPTSGPCPAAGAEDEIADRVANAATIPAGIAIKAHFRAGDTARPGASAGLGPVVHQQYRPDGNVVRWTVDHHSMQAGTVDIPVEVETR